ncbi:MAG: CRISPR-associated endonuclease Cas3'' [Proteobacteria bacterium]|nr:CRISPR-associated endonuclease Cas3'' [Pseudomonadota bacterium]
MATPWAHSGAHLLADHLLAVAKTAATSAAAIERSGAAARWSYAAGLWHDLGKYRPGFQQYVRLADGENAHIEGKVASRDKNHSAAGALWAEQLLTQKQGPAGKLAARVLMYLIAGHHAGLADWHQGLRERLAETESQRELAEALAAQPPKEILHGAAPALQSLRHIPGGLQDGFALWLRMLFSCLVDADFLDTEAHFDAAKPRQRSGFPTLAQMHAAFNAHMAALPVRDTPVNRLRADILRQCRSQAALAPGFFSLTVPTGGGKTLSSLAFALEHAQAHGQRRIIYAIPYTSIIEQTADVFRQVFAALGDEVLIEHHSQAESAPEQETARSRLACENWDAPLVVTTNVQLFESLFAAKTSRCRKLHNIAGSVIVLDEAQQLPPAFLQPILDVLNLLVAHYGVTVLLCTATQPALSSTAYFDASKSLRGLKNVREIITEPDALFVALERVCVQLPADWNQSTPWPQLAEQLAQEDCVLAIVSTRKSARTLHALMPEGTLHLSAQMCGAHRQTVIAEIKQRLQALRDGSDLRPLRVVSTQLVEAGVDIDFPVVYRAVAGLDSIAQAAGRCNREGLLPDKGRVVVFVPEDAPPPGSLRQAAQAAVKTLQTHTGQPLERALFERYFRAFYYAQNLDEKAIVTKLRPDRELAVQFATAAQDFKLIDEDGSATVVVRYGAAREEIKQLLGVLAAEGPQRWLMRRLQRFTVTIPQRMADKMLAQGSLSLPMPGLYVQADIDNLYSDDRGLRGDDDPGDPRDYYL